MRPTTLFIIFAIGALGALAYLGKQSGVEMPSVEIPDIKIPDIELPKLIKNRPPPPTTVYKWQDEKGEWHYSSEAPPQQPGVEQIQLNTEQALIPGMLPP